MNRKLYINIPVEDLTKSKEFFKNLGFTFNSDFDSEQSAGMVINEDSFMMLSTKEFFKSAIKKELADTNNALETIIAVSAASREEIDDIIEKAIANGGVDIGDTIDDEFMYDRGFYDLDGHLWRFNYLKP